MTDKMKKYLPWFFLFISAGMWLVLYLLRVEKLLDADMSSEMVLSKMLATEGRIITPNWKYSTEIRFLNNQLFYSLFLAITKSFRMSRLLSGVALLAIYGAGYYYLCAQAGLKKYFPHTAALLFLPFSPDYSYIVLYGLYYIPHIVISFVSAGLCLRIEKAEAGKRKIPVVLLLILSFLAGMGGPRQIVVTYLPFFLLAVIRSYEERHFRYLGAWLMFIGGCIGYAGNRVILSKHYLFNGWDNIRFRSFSFARLEQLLMGIVYEYGYTDEPLFSAALIKNAAAMIILGGIFLYYIRYFRNVQKREKEECIVAEATLAMAIVYFLLYLFTDMLYEDRYALPIIVYVIPVLGFALQRVEAESKDLRTAFWGYLIPVTVIAAFWIAGLGRYPGLFYKDLTTDLKEVTDALVAQGYENGYASYWNGNIVTELSEGRIEMFNWDDHVDDNVDVERLYIWMQPVEHARKQAEGKQFILLDTKENLECPLVGYLSEKNVAFRNGSYVAYGFEDHEAMLAELSEFHYDLNRLLRLEGGYVDDGKWVLPAGTETGGPNMTLYAGNYHFIMNGRGLDCLKVRATSYFKEEEIPVQIVSQTPNYMEVQLTVQENTYHVEFCLSNEAEQDILIDSAEVERTP